MAERRVVVASKVGLHARPAALFVKAAGACGLPVTITKDGAASADARSILSVLSLDVRGGDEVVVRVDGDGAEAALDELVSLLTAPDA
jgi:phosphocarrier protein HPr